MKKPDAACTTQVCSIQTVARKAYDYHMKIFLIRNKLIGAPGWGGGGVLGGGGGGGGTLAVEVGAGTGGVVSFRGLALPTSNCYFLISLS